MQLLSWGLSICLCLYWSLSFTHASIFKVTKVIKIIFWGQVYKTRKLWACNIETCAQFIVMQVQNETTCLSRFHEAESSLVSSQRVANIRIYSNLRIFADEYFRFSIFRFILTKQIYFHIHSMKYSYYEYICVFVQWQMNIFAILGLKKVPISLDQIFRVTLHEH